MLPRGVKVKDHGSTMLTGHGTWLPRVGYSGRLTGVGNEHNARALITCMALGILPPALAPSSTSFRYYCCDCEDVVFSVLQSLSGHV